MGGSASKKRSRSSRSVRRSSSYSQEFFDYIFNYSSPRCASLNEPIADEPTASSSSGHHHTATSHPLPSAPVLPYVYDDEEENQIGMAMAISASQEVNAVDEEDRQIDTAIWASLEAPNTSSYGQEWPSSRFDNGSSSSSSSSQPKEHPNHFSRETGRCGICFEVISMPATCDPCGHVSCYECLLRIQGSTNKCPRCRGEITKVMRIYL